MLFSTFTTAPDPRRTGETRHLLPELQGLRAVAVVLVIATHVNASLLPGGFIGVDVFFVLSGFLITGMLLRELREHGRIGLGRFYTRRVRRLLPAASLVLVATGTATVLLVPAEAAETGRHMVASALVSENLLLAFAAEPGFQPTAHYWSLSVEEQFYLVWPLVLLGWAMLPPRLRRVRTLLLTGLAITTASYAASGLLTPAEGQGDSYFLPYTRAWEMGVGCVLALLLAQRRVPDRLRTPLGWAGLAAIGASAFLFDYDTAFPGWLAALPVLGAAAVIAAADSPGRFTAYRLLTTAPARFLGDISYALYLWHWPIVVLWPAVTGRDALSWLDGLLVVALSVLLAWGTKLFVEDPIRHGRLLRDGRAAAAFAAASVLLVAALAWGMLAFARPQEGAAAGAAADSAAGAAADIVPPRAPAASAHI